MPIQEGISVGIFKAGTNLKTTSEPIFSGGYGRGYRIEGDTITNYKFTSASKLNEGGYYNVYAGTAPYRPGATTTIKGINVFSEGVRSKAYSFGKIGELTDQGSSPIIIFSGGSKTSLASTFSNAGAGTAVGATLKASTFSVPSISPSTLTQSYGASTFVLGSATKTAPYIQTPRMESSLQTSNLSRVLPATSTASVTSLRQESVVIPVTRSGSGIVAINNQNAIIIPAIAQNTGQATLQRTGLRSGLISPGAFRGGSYAFKTPTLTGGGGVFIPRLDFNNIGIMKNVLKGGKRKTGYIPSFSALAFKKFGKYKAGKLSKSGLDFRPINTKFKIQRIKKI
jgi:hypothetical protein